MDIFKIKKKFSIFAFHLKSCSQFSICKLSNKKSAICFLYDCSTILSLFSCRHINQADWRNVSSRRWNIVTALLYWNMPSNHLITWKLKDGYWRIQKNKFRFGNKWKSQKKILALVGVESSENGFHVMTEISREIESLRDRTKVSNSVS